MYITKKELEHYNVNVSLNELEEIFNSIGHEVENIQTIENEMIVIGKIISAQPVEESDKLNLCQVDVGKEKLQIVCGAKNVLQAKYVAVALPGCKLREFKIEKRKLFNIESNGMICSLGELGFMADNIDKSISDGIIHLERLKNIEDLNIGENVFKFLQLEDKIIELAITPNREECKSYKGILQDLYPICNCDIIPRKISKDEELIYSLKHQIENSRDEIKIRQDNKYEFAQKPNEIIFNLIDTQKLMGIKLFDSTKKVKDFLEKLNYKVEINDLEIKTIPPKNRMVENHQDVFFDLLRYNLKKVNKTLEDNASIGSEFKYKNKKTKILNSTEVVTYSLISQQEKELFKFENNFDYIKVDNIMSEEREYYRQLIFPQMIEVLKYNMHHDINQNIYLSEIGNIYYKDDGKQKEEEHLSLLCHNEINQNEIEKYILDNNLEKRKNKISFLNLKNSYKLIKDGKVIGFCGSIDYNIVKQIHIKNLHQIFILEIKIN